MVATDFLTEIPTFCKRAQNRSRTPEFWNCSGVCPRRGQSFFYHCAFVATADCMPQAVPHDSAQTGAFVQRKLCFALHVLLNLRERKRMSRAYSKIPAFANVFPPGGTQTGASEKAEKEEGSRCAAFRVQTHAKMQFFVYNNMMMLPAVMNRTPSIVFACAGSPRKMIAMHTVMATLNLSMGATFDTSPSWSALK